MRALKEKGIQYVGSGVSGGEDGARYGPSLMPGGAPEAWLVCSEDHLKIHQEEESPTAGNCTRKGHGTRD